MRPTLRYAKVQAYQSLQGQCYCLMTDLAVAGVELRGIDLMTYDSGLLAYKCSAFYILPEVAKNHKSFCSIFELTVTFVSYAR